MKKLLSIMLAACLLLGALPFTASAAETVTLKATKTDVKADSVVNYGGYGSLTVEGAFDMGSNTVIKLPQAGLMDKSGRMLFPMRETCNRFFYSDGVVSLTSGTPNWPFADQTAPPDGYGLDNTPRFFDISGAPLTFSTAEYSHSGPMMDGHAIVFKNIDTDNRALDTYILDKGGNEVCIFQDNEIKSMGFADQVFFPRFSTGWFGERLMAYYDHSWDDLGNSTTKVLGYMDSTGKTVIDLSDRGYINAFPFTNGIAVVINGEGKCGFINKSGELVIPCEYDDVVTTYDSLIVVKKDGKWGAIDAQNNVIVPFSYESSFGTGDDGITAVGNDGKYGLIDRNNNVVLPLEYDDVSTFTDGVAYAIKDGYVYIITKDETPAKPTVGGFSDVYEGDYYADAVVWAVENDVTSGVGSGKFAPGNNCTREQIVTFLWRANGSPEPKTTVNPFTDVGQSSYAYKAILWAVENDITSGTGNGKFSPGASCTRDQAVTFLWRSEGKPTEASGSSFTDVKTGDYFADAVAWAVANNITSGVGNNRFNPTGTCTRGQIVTFLYRNK